MKKLLSFILSIFYCGIILAQDFKADIKSVNNYYNTAQNFTSTVTTKVLGPKDKAMGTYKMTLYKNKSSFAYEIQNVVVILSEKYFLTVDKVGKMIDCKRIKDKKKLSEMMSQQLDAVLNKLEGVSYKGITNGNKHYYIELSDAVVTSIDLYIDAKQPRYTKMIYYYNREKEPSGAERAVIEFEKSDLSSEALTSLFSEETYLNFEKTQPSKHAKYKSYTLVMDNKLIK